MNLHWHRHFLDRCLTVSKMSKDPSTQVGVVIVDTDGVPRTDGFNGFPRGILDTPSRLSVREMKYRLVVHAERNAVCNAARIGVSLKGCTLYVTCRDVPGNYAYGSNPCPDCTLELIQAGIRRVVTYASPNMPAESNKVRWAADYAFAMDLLKEAGVSYLEVDA